MAEAWLVLQLTGSGTAVGATFAFRFAPVFLFGLWGGAVADRHDGHRLLVGTQLALALLGVALGRPHRSRRRGGGNRDSGGAAGGPLQQVDRCAPVR